MERTEWLDTTGDNLASNERNWSNGLPSNWNTPFFDLTSRVEITWDLRSFSPDNYEWIGDAHNLVCTYSLCVFVGGTPWVPSWLVALVQQNGVEARIDQGTLPAPPPGEEYTLRTTGEKFIIDGDPLEALGYSSLNWVVFGHDILPLPKGGADKTWDGGGGDEHFSDDQNWNGDVKPAAGDNLIFDGAVSNKACDVEGVLGAYGTLTISNGYTATITVNVNWTVTTTSITSNATINASGANATFSALTINSATAVVKAAATRTLKIDGTISLASGTLGVAATAFILDINASLSGSSGTLIAPSAAGTFTMSGLLWTDGGGFTHSSGTVQFDRSGSLTTLGGNSTQFYDVYVNDACGLGLDTFNFTAARNVTLGTGTSGTVTTSTGTKRIDGTLTINAGGSFGTAATTYTLDINASNAASAGTLIAPQAAGTFTFSGATFYTPTTFTHSSGTVTFDLAGTTTLGNNSTQFNAITVSDGATLASSTYNLTAAGAMTVGGGATGTFTTSTGTKQIDGTLTINAGASFGTATTTYTLDLNGDLNSSAGTLIAPNVSGTFTFSGATFNTPTVFTHSSGTIQFDLAGTTTLGNNSTAFYTVTVNDGTTLASSTYNFTAAGAMTVGGGASGAFTTSTGTKTLNGTLTINAGGSFGTATTTYTLNLNGTLATSTGTLIAPQAGAFTFSGATWNTPTTFTHSSGQVSFSGVNIALGNDSTQFYNIRLNGGMMNPFVFATTSYNLQCNDFSFVDYFGSGTTASVTGGTKRIDGTLTIDGTSTFGTAATAYTLDINGSIATSAGTLIAPQAAGSFTFSGATWNTPTTFTHSSGTVTFDLAGTTTLGSNSTQFNAITINPATLDTSAASSFSLTAAGATSVTGTLTTNASVVSLMSAAAGATAVTVAGTWTCGSATITAGNVAVGAAGTLTMGSAHFTINGTDAGGFGWSHTAGATYTVGSSHVTSTAAHKINPTFWDYTINNVLVTLAEALQVDNDFTILGGAGELDTAAGSDWGVAVVAATAAAGTLRLQNSACSFGTLTVTGVLACGANAITMNGFMETTTAASATMGTSTVTFVVTTTCGMLQAAPAVFYNLTVVGGSVLTKLNPMRVSNVMNLADGGVDGAHTISLAYNGAPAATPLVAGLGFMGFGTTPVVAYQGSSDYVVESVAYPILWLTKYGATGVATLLGTVTCDDLILRHWDAAENLELDLLGFTLNVAGDVTVTDATMAYGVGSILNFNGVALQTITVPAGDFYVPEVTVAAGASVITTNRLKVNGTKTGVTATLGPPVMDRFIVDGDMTIDALGSFTHAPEYATGGGGFEWWL